jgi:putative ABC transport system permease protein
VRRRTGEIGLRMALGASRRDVIGLVVRRGLGLTALGLLAGGAAALLLGRLLSSVLYAVDSRDPASFAAAGLVLLGAAALAAGIPARRAAQVDPAVALRQE